MEMEDIQKAMQTSTFDLHALARKFPPTADTMLLDMRLTDEPAASSRLFRILQAGSGPFSPDVR
jgi:hypothetical protein